MEVVPVSHFIQNLTKPYMNLNHRGLGPKGVKAIAIALVSNATVTHLELEDNCIRAEGAICIAEMLRENSSLQELVPNLTQNYCSPNSWPNASWFTEDKDPYSCRPPNSTKGEISPLLTYFSSPGNNFGEETAPYFAEALMPAGRSHCLYTFISMQSNYQVKKLDLSHNEFSEKGGQLLGQMLANNTTLEILDLSWNHLRRKGIVALGTVAKIPLLSLEGNGTLKILNLSWNGIGNEGALALGEALKVNNVLVHLDISNNQIENEGAKKLCRGLEVNGNLKILKMASNPLTVEGATALVVSVRKNPRSMMEEINISTRCLGYAASEAAQAGYWLSHGVKPRLASLGESWQPAEPARALLLCCSLGVHADCTFLLPTYQNVLVNETFIKLLDAVCQMRPELDVIHGEVEGCITTSHNQHPNPTKVIQNYLKEHNLQLWDFFRNIDRDGSMKIPVAAFRRAMLQQQNIPLNRVQIGELVRKLDQNRTGVVDYR
ncbi:Uncharacterized protein C14orf166B [Tyto alba]|nr:Uncharacterized protein C14orf166B [Tyto alba]